MIGKKKISPFFRGTCQPVDKLPEVADLADEQLAYYKSIGVETIFIDETLTAYELAKEAASALLLESDLSPAAIDLIIVIRSRLPETFISSETTRLQHDLGAVHAQCFSIGDLGCTDMSVAIKTGHDFLVANKKAEHVLIVHGCKPFSPTRFRYPVTITGDGGLAVLLGRTERNAIIDFRLETNGKYWDLFLMDYQQKTFEQYKEVCTDPRKYAFELALESRNRFQEINSGMLNANGIGKEEVQHFILQNVSNRAFEYDETAFGVSVSPVCAYNLSRYGHLGPNDIMVNLNTGIEEGIYHEGDLVLIMNNSPVAAWSSLLLRI